MKINFKLYNELFDVTKNYGVINGLIEILISTPFIIFFVYFLNSNILLSIILLIQLFLLLILI
ncbi:MAG: hypothetical protein KDD29_07410, partial [Flavobacteriales bacterium]|nr:hypothetical protein [Flavobacteriales bacterium]